MKHSVLGALRPTVGNTVRLTDRFSGRYPIIDLGWTACAKIRSAWQWATCPLNLRSVSLDPRADRILPDIGNSGHISQGGVTCGSFSGRIDGLAKEFE